LIAEKFAFSVVSRQGVDSQRKPIRWDLENAASSSVVQQLASCDTLIHCAPIWLLPQHMEVLHKAGINRMIVFGSTSVISKRLSADKHEKKLVAQLARAEQKLNEYCKDNAISLTILRPSMIYGYGLDQNITRIAAFIRRFGFAVLVGRAKGLRQPVHTDDLVDAVLATRENSKSFGKTYNLAGGESLSYTDMVERIFMALHKNIRIIPLPLPIVRGALRAAGVVGSFAYTPEMADRMNQDLAYDYSDATADFDYQPQPFLNDPVRDLPLPAHKR
jgi:nucleoside-diphosphate-sugar epimerase